MPVLVTQDAEDLAERLIRPLAGSGMICDVAPIIEATRDIPTRCGSVGMERAPCCRARRFSDAARILSRAPGRP